MTQGFRNLHGEGRCKHRTSSSAYKTGRIRKETGSFVFKRTQKAFKRETAAERVRKKMGKNNKNKKNKKKKKKKKIQKKKKKEKKKNKTNKKKSMFR